MFIRFHYFFPLLLTTLSLTACGQVGRDAVSMTPQIEVSEAEGSGTSLDLMILTGADSILRAVNVQRADAGVPALLSLKVLNDLAIQRSTDMSVRDYLDHEDPQTGESLLQQMLSAEGYEGPVAELVFAAQDPLESVPERVSDAWFSDPMHKALLLEPTFRYCGIGMMGDGDLWKVTLILAVNLPEESAN